MSDLRFREAPDWLLQSYIENKNRNPVVDGLNAAATIAQQYNQAKKQQQSDQLASRKLDATDQELAMKQREQFYNYGDISSLPKDQANQIGQPLEGPPTAEGVGPQKSPVIQHFESFLAQNPQGIKGQTMTEDNLFMKDPETGALIPTGTSQRRIKGKNIVSGGPGSLDQKRTFQEKQDVFDGSGTPIGYMTFDTRSGQKVFNPYDKSGLPSGSTFGPKVKPEIPSAAVEKNAAQVGFLDLIKDIRDNYDKDFVGPIDSKWTNLKQTVDMPSIGMGATKKAADFTRPIADLQSAIVNERTGAAVGERKEWDRLAAILADVSRSDTDFLAKLDNVEKRYNQIIENRNTAFGKTGYRNQSSGVKGGSETPAQRKARLIQELSEGR